MPLGARNERLARRERDALGLVRALIIYSRNSRAALEKVWRLFSPPVNAISWNDGEFRERRRRFSAEHIKRATLAAEVL